MAAFDSTEACNVCRLLAYGAFAGALRFVRVQRPGRRPCAFPTERLATAYKEPGLVAIDPSVMTVLGPVSAGELGVVLPREHVLIDTTVCYWQEPEDGAARNEPVEMSRL